MSKLERAHWELLAALKRHKLVRSGQHAPLQMINSGDGDCAVLPQATEAPGLTAFPLLKDYLVAVVPADSPLAPKASLKPKDFSANGVCIYRQPLVSSNSYCQML